MLYIEVNVLTYLRISRCLFIFRCIVLLFLYTSAQYDQSVHKILCAIIRNFVFIYFYMFSVHKFTKNHSSCVYHQNFLFQTQS
ncbi:unnamed protein product [Trichobilharzia szidati]|nr:unnamed protein product [Trichobilharzia szidati]